MESDLEKNTEFIVGVPKGNIGSPQINEQFMLIEDLYKQVEKLQQTQEQDMTNKVNIEFHTKQIEKLLKDVEKSKKIIDKYTNGSQSLKTVLLFFY